jgi:hypothetical protein
MSDAEDRINYYLQGDWPCDHGLREAVRRNLAGRIVRRKWMRCIGVCRRWFWSEDVVNHRMCRLCALGLRSPDGLGGS